MPQIRPCEVEHPERLDIIGSPLDAIMIDEPEPGNYRPLIAEVVLIARRRIYSLEAFNRPCESADLFVARDSRRLRGDGILPDPPDHLIRNVIVWAGHLAVAGDAVTVVDDPEAVSRCFGRTVQSLRGLTVERPHQVDRGWLVRLDLGLEGTPQLPVLSLGIWRKERCLSPVIGLAATQDDGALQETYRS